MTRIDTNRLRHFVVFLGNPRSGTTLVASLLNAHPEVCISIEVNVIARLREGADWESIRTAITANAARFARNPTWTDYSYAVASVGERSPAPLVLGDKKAANTTAALADDWAPVEHLAALCQPATLKVVHCVRHPLDTISTRMQRRGCGLDEASSRYFELERLAAEHTQRPPLTDAHRVHLEALIRSPQGTLTALLDFLGLEMPADYLDACRGLLYDEPRQTRHNVPWTREALEDVARQTRTLPHLAPYAVDTDSAARAGSIRAPLY